MNVSIKEEHCLNYEFVGSLNCAMGPLTWLRNCHLRNLSDYQVESIYLRSSILFVVSIRSHCR